MKKYTSVEEYYGDFTEDVHAKMMELRSIILKTAPEAQEVLSYNMPAFKQQEVLVYFAVYKGHIGFYPTAKPIEVFADDLKAYKTSKGTIQLPYNEKLPAALLQKIVQYRVKSVKEKAAAKKEK